MAAPTTVHEVASIYGILSATAPVRQPDGRRRIRLPPNRT